MISVIFINVFFLAGGGYGGAGGEGGGDEGAGEQPDTDDDEKGPAVTATGLQGTGQKAHRSRSDSAHRGVVGSSSLSAYYSHHHHGASTTSGGGSQHMTRVNWGATRRAFFRVFVSLLLKYREFLVYPTQDIPFPRSRCVRYSV